MSYWVNIKILLKKKKVFKNFFCKEDKWLSLIEFVYQNYKCLSTGKITSSCAKSIGLLYFTKPRKYLKNGDPGSRNDNKHKWEVKCGGRFIGPS